MLNWEYVLDVPPGTVLTDESVDAYIQAFLESGYAKERGTSKGTYPVEEWDNSRFEIPASVSFGTKRIPGADPFYFVNQENEQGDIYAHFSNIGGDLYV